MKFWKFVGGTFLAIAVVILSVLGTVTAVQWTFKSEGVWSGRVDQPDPRDLNRAESAAFHTRWAATMKAEKERIAVEEKRKADEAEQARRATQEAQERASRTTVAPRPTAVVPNPYRPNQGTAVPPGDPWMDTYNRLSSSLPGNWAIGDKGSWGAASPDNGNVWIARRTPLYALASVMIHESCHVRQGRAFGSYAAAKAALAPYGGVERTADACAKNGGATWIGYGVDAKAFEGARLF